MASKQTSELNDTQNKISKEGTNNKKGNNHRARSKRDAPNDGPKQMKITNFINNAYSNSTAGEPETEPEDDKLDILKKELQTKEEQCNKIKTSKQIIEDKYSKLYSQNKNYKQKSKEIIISLMKEEAQNKRREKVVVDHDLGFFANGLNNFREGFEEVRINKQISDIESQIQKLRESSKYSKDSELKERIKLSVTLLTKRLELKKLQKAQIQKKVNAYKERYKLGFKQLTCHYAEKKWPIVQDNKGSQRYLPMQLLGKGGFGEVYKCFDLQKLNYVALKVNQIKLNTKSEHFEQEMKHLKREVSTHMQLDHPNIAKIIQVLEITYNEIKFVLQLCEGPQLSTYLKQYQCLQQKDAKPQMHQLFSVLDYLQQCDPKIIHYDLKPSNLMLHKGNLKVLDFGLCKLMEDGTSRMELTSQGTGTYWYLPPETFMPPEEAAATTKIDVWSAGVIFFELLYGRRPFAHGISQQKIYRDDMIPRQAKKPLIFPTQTPRKFKVSNEAKDFILECLTYLPSKRISANQAYNHPYFKS